MWVPRGGVDLALAFLSEGPRFEPCPRQLWKKLFQDESSDSHTREWDDNACIIGAWHNSLDRSLPWYLVYPLSVKGTLSLYRLNKNTNATSKKLRPHCKWLGCQENPFMQKDAQWFMRPRGVPFDQFLTVRTIQTFTVEVHIPTLITLL